MARVLATPREWRATKDERGRRWDDDATPRARADGAAANDAEDDRRCISVLCGLVGDWCGGGVLRGAVGERRRKLSAADADADGRR